MGSANDILAVERVFLRGADQMDKALSGIRVIDITRSFDAVRMWTPKFPT
jgi:hypothetical protein